MKLFKFGLSLMALGASQLSLAFTQEISSAVQRFANGNASDTDRALLLAKNRTINEMRVKGVINDSSYQAAQSFYSTTVEDIARTAAQAHGAQLTVQQRIGAVDAGTDSDFILNTTTAEQTANIQMEFNQLMDRHLSQLGYQPEPDSAWHEINDVDFMSDPGAGASEQEVKKIGKLNNDAYINIDAIRFEAGSREIEAALEAQRTEGTPIPEGIRQPTMAEAKAYSDEMRAFLAKKQHQNQLLLGRLEEHNRRAKVNGPETEVNYAKRMSLEAKIQINHALQAKYINRLHTAQDIMSVSLGIDAPSHSDLPDTARRRAANIEFTESEREIRSALAASTANVISKRAAINESLILAIEAERDPSLAQQNRKKIVELSAGLNTSQKNTLLETLQGNQAIGLETQRHVLAEIRNNHQVTARPPKQLSSSGNDQTDPAISASRQRLQLSGQVSGLVGDFMSVKDQLQKAHNGSHLLFNIEEQDSQGTKLLKQAGVAMMELGPLSFTDALNRGFDVQEEVEKELLQKIQRGEHVPPAIVVAKIFGKVGYRTVSSMTIDPLLLGAEAVGEGVNTVSDVGQNILDDSKRNLSFALQTQKFEQIQKRQAIIKLGQLSAVNHKASGAKTAILDNVEHGDRLVFTMVRGEHWSDNYQIKWELHSPYSKLYSSTLMDATSAEANSLTHTNTNLEPGKHKAIFRIFDKTSNKQMDFNEYEFVVSSKFGMSPILARYDNGQAFQTPLYQGQKLNFSVNKHGSWTDKHTVQWFHNGDQVKSAPASYHGIEKMTFTFDSYFKLGQHTVSIRALEAGKIKASRKFSFLLKDKSQKNKPGNDNTAKQGEPTAGKIAKLKKEASAEGDIDNNTDSKAYELAYCRTYRKDLLEAQETLRKEEDKYFSLYKTFLRSGKNYFKTKDLLSKIKAAESAASQAVAAKNKARYDAIYSEHRLLVDQYNDLLGKIRDINQIFQNNPNTAQCQTVVDGLSASHEREQLFNSITRKAGLLPFYIVSDSCKKIQTSFAKQQEIIKAAKAMNCNRFGKKLEQ